MTAPTVHLVRDPKVKRRVVFAVGRHMGWESETIHAIQEEDALFSDGVRFMLVPSEDEALYISLPFTGPVLRIKTYPEMTVAEQWRLGFQEDVVLLETEGSP
jgi:hypothetical protein